MSNDVFFKKKEKKPYFERNEKQNKEMEETRLFLNKKL